MKDKENLRKCGLEGMSSLFLGFLHEPRSCAFQSGLETLPSPKAHRKGLPAYYSKFHPIGDF